MPDPRKIIHSMNKKIPALLGRKMGIIIEGNGFSLTKEPLLTGKMFKKGTVLVLQKITQLRRQQTKFFRNVRYDREFRMVYVHGDVWGRF